METALLEEEANGALRSEGPGEGGRATHALAAARLLPLLRAAPAARLLQLLRDPRLQDQLCVHTAPPPPPAPRPRQA